MGCGSPKTCVKHSHDKKNNRTDTHETLVIIIMEVTTDKTAESVKGGKAKETLDTCDEIDKKGSKTITDPKCGIDVDKSTKKSHKTILSEDLPGRNPNASTVGMLRASGACESSPERTVPCIERANCCAPPDSLKVKDRSYSPEGS